MNETITSNLIALTNLLDGDDLRLIQEESSKRNFFYSLHCINKLGAVKIKELLQAHTFINIAENAQSLAELIVNSYIKNFKESLFVTLAHEFNILVEDQVLDDNLSIFIGEITNDGEWQEYFFDKYPLVEKLLESTIDNALKFTLQFLKDLDEDYHEINSTFKVDLRDLITLEMSISDNHNNQSGVVKMAFSSTSLYYKPRSLQPEKKIYEFFSFVQNFGLKKSIYIPVMIDRSSHGWMEGVDFQAVETEAELLEFYENQGINLGLFYFLGVADLIGDNIIAKGVLPCYFDLECIVQPDIDDLDIELFELNSYAAKMIRTSVLRTNLLPQYGFVTHEFQGISVSGLSYVKGSYPEMKIENTNGQFKRYYENAAFSHKNLQLPIENVSLESEIYVPSIVKGFSTAYKMVMKHQKEISEYIIDYFSDIKIRILYRPTYIYSKLLTESYLPYYLTDDSNRNTLLSSLRNLQSDFLQNSPIIDSEIAQLDGQDIPIFYGYSQSTSINSNKGILQNNYFNTSGLEAALGRIQSASEGDLRSQTELIKLSFSIHEGYDLKNNIYKGKNYDIESSTENIGSDTINVIKSQIEMIFDKIQEKTDNSQKDFSAWSLFQTPNYTWDISSVKWGLFDGLDGLSFFYLNLYKVLGNQKALDIGKYYLEKGLQQFDQYEELYAAKTAFNKVSLFNYPVSTFYVAEYYLQSGISVFLPDYLVDKLIKWITDYYTNDKDYDLVSGGAGTILYLLKLYERLPSESLLELAENIASHLVNGAVKIDTDKICWVTEFGKAHTGLSHGSSGIALVLLKLYKHRKLDWLHREAVKALEYERSMYDNDNQYWYTFRLLEQNMDIKAENHFWAYGSAGILLCRLLLADDYQDERIEGEIEVAKRNILSKGYMTNFNYSSGFIGNLDVLNEYSLLRKDKELKQKLLCTVEKIVKEKADFDEWACVPFGKGNRSSIEMIGLFTGISGIGNTLLNIIDNEKLSNKLFT